VTVPGIATLFEKAGLCTKSDFFAALSEITLEGKLLQNVNSEKTYEALEGYLFPDTYEFFVGEDSKKYAKLAHLICAVLKTKWTAACYRHRPFGLMLLI
ncbi:MAG: hypothetical protein IIX30_03880, partial [Clostridia bacterium]|nr:hypothetical protein [Clostridia bacterium]